MENPREIIRNSDHDELIEAVREWANCEIVNLDGEGNIWIEGPQRGHWLDDDKLATFVAWAQAQEAA